MIVDTPEAEIHTETCTRCNAIITDYEHAFASDDYAMAKPICYQCAYLDDIKYASEHGRLFAYTKGAHLSNKKVFLWVSLNTYNGYIPSIVTWTGIQLNSGPVHIQRIWRSNFGDRRIAFTCQLPTGTEGKLEHWYGTAYYDAGDYVRLRRFKNQ